MNTDLPTSATQRSPQVVSRQRHATHKQRAGANTSGAGMPDTTLTARTNLPDRLVGPQSIHADKPAIDCAPELARLGSITWAESKAHLASLFRYASGLHASSYDPAFQLFSHPSVPNGAVAFRIERGCAVNLGGPLCTAKDIPQLMGEFRAWCKTEKMPSIFIGVTNPEFLDYARRNCMSMMETGVEQWIDPSQAKLSKNLRANLNAARNKGVSIQEYRVENDPDGSLRRELEALVPQVIAQRVGLQVYASDMQPFADTINSRWFYAAYEGRVVGLANLMGFGEGRYGIDNCIDLNVPKNRISHALHVTIVQTLQQEGASFLSFNFAQIPQLGDVSGFSPLSEKIARWAHGKTSDYLHVQGKIDFRERYGAMREHGRRGYVVFDPPTVGLKHSLAVMQAMHVDPKEVFQMVGQWAIKTAAQRTAKAVASAARVGRNMLQKTWAYLVQRGADGSAALRRSATSLWRWVLDGSAALGRGATSLWRWVVTVSAWQPEYMALREPTSHSAGKEKR